ncbi:Mur ligase family protein [Metabacillus elymi]|uniref:UDP-N-acetylmuramoyl-tripeptide--D-alanyl-D-alanine ligase n=1 Tax=Metabacillus elymi TaxID=2745198 RepID=A0ABX6S5W4_9BACI|nr:UDP-N-acetylmuramoyl-tripeptide--D-alanyl-D-alanine ligase [Metabacillus sp. KUDC1714]QNF28918.1 UDP-N-acetylmuramoyl-tripeptide--D-alanyl-D-alanine ligase [Metabacillus sp. KUDC1714]
MIHLPLSTILLQIGGVEFLQGYGNPVIHYVMNVSKREIDDNTLVFHMDHEKINGKYWKNNESIVIVTDRPDLCTDLGDSIFLIKTEDLDEAYWKFVTYYRGLFDIPVIGVTGTCGKTTTKEMIRQILKYDFNVKATWMSMNSMSVNLRYLMKLEKETEIAVYEMPVAYPGYLKVACTYFQPQIRILLNIGVHHLADCETPEEYMKAKAEIVDGLDPEHGVLILNADDENIKRVVNVNHLKRVVYFGKSEHSDFRATNIQYANDGMIFTLAYLDDEYDVFVPGYGEHNIYNALASIAAVSYAGVTIERAIELLASFEQVKEHLEFKAGKGGCTVIDDTWNSAPLSMATGLQVLSDVSKDKKSIALLGYMPQLGKGPYAVEQYEEMGRKAVEANIDMLVVVGEKAKYIGLGAIKHGMDPNKIHYCETGYEVFDLIEPYLSVDTNILLKITYRVMKRESFKKLRKNLIQHDDE